ncbi:hypothetical protein BWP39_09885 [Paraburkholderia acidicola]|uniref:Virulence sensor protein BvgS n=2 Tax=Paraburkholderia acidicola TaxID=1912599 RepID=A0A2A4F3W9_9BURK|nr:hypothetical protein BWP39_09885 [Paraburkholderia acidicola]
MRNSEEYSSIILFGAGILLTLAILAALALLVRAEINREIDRLNAQFDEQITDVTRHFQFLSGRFVRTNDLFRRLLEVDVPDPLVQPDEAGDTSVGADRDMSGCPINFYFSAKNSNGLKLPCTTRISRTLMNWIFDCDGCDRVNIAEFDLNGNYLAEFSHTPQPAKFQAGDYILSRTRDARKALAGLPHSSYHAATAGVWLPPRLDPATGQHVVDYASIFLLDNRPAIGLIRTMDFSRVVRDSVSEHTARSLLVVTPDQIVQFGGERKSDANQDRILKSLLASTTDAVKADWFDGKLYLSRGLPTPHWAWVQVIDSDQVAIDTWHDSKGSILSFVTLIITLWVSIFWFHRRVLTPMERNSTRGRESAAFEQTMVESLPVGFVAMRSRSRDFLIENRMAREILRSEDGEVALDNVLDRLVSHEFAVTPSLTVDVDIGRPGESKHYEFVFRSTAYVGADIILLAIYDVTASRQTESLLRQARIAAEDASKAKSDFVAFVSHEIRTPLHGALSNLELLSLDTSSGAEHKRIGVIRQAFSSLLALLDNALDLSKLDSQLFQVRLEPFRPRELIEGTVIAALPLVSGRDIRINCHVEEAPGELIGDASLLRHVVVNLLHNALKFTMRGKIEIRCRAVRDASGCVELIIYVADTGMGISAEDIKQIFEPYTQSSTTSNAVLRGTGLGLALCKKICEQLGGKIDVSSRVGEGSTFTVRIPVALSDAVTEPPAWPAPDGRGVVVLLARDEMPNDLPDLLAQAGWPVEVRIYDPEQEIGKRSDAVLRVLVVPKLVVAADLGCEVDLVVADDGPLNPVIHGGASVVSAYSIDGLREAWYSLTDQPLTDAGNLEGGRIEALSGLETIRVLIADDDEICRRLVQDQLSLLGIGNVDLASDGDEGLERVHGHDYDLILTDLNMPQSDGRFFIAALGDLSLRAKVILTTADLSWEQAVKSAGHRVDAVLTKPWSIEALRDTIDRAFGTHSKLSPANPAANATLAALLASTLPDNWASARKALADGDVPLFQRRLHTMSGALLFVGEEAFVARLRLLEKDCMSADTSALVAGFDSLAAWMDGLIAGYAARQPRVQS